VSWLHRRVDAVRARRDDGQLLLLVLAYAVIAGLLVTVVVNVSKAYLFRRALVSAADGAALAAANEPDLDQVYAEPGENLPLSGKKARAAVRQYVEDAQLEERLTDFEVDSVTTDGVTVVVTFRGTVQLPFANLLTSSDGYQITATANATSPLSR
jgi:hypothetical protein